MNAKDWTDDALLAALRRGDPDRRRAWEHIYKHWRGVWLSLILQRGGTADEAEDALGRVAVPFERAVTAEGFRLERATLRTYLVSCVLRAWVKLRQQNPPPTLPIDEAPVAGVAESVEKRVVRHELAAAVDALIDILGERCRRVLRMFGRGDTMEQIAGAEGWKDAAKAKKEKYECQTKLKNHLRDNPDLAARIKDLWHD